MKYFVTGTDTNVGKTVVSAILSVGFGAHYWKAVQTGTIESSDSDFVARWIGRERVLPETYRFREPLSPHAAAALENETISMPHLLDSLPDVPGALVIEGAGGLMVPLNDRHYMIDLMQALEVPVVLVARSTLGTLNHTFLSLEALRARRIPIAGVVLVGEDNPSNFETIAHMGQVHLWGRIPLAQEFSVAWMQDCFARLKIPETRGESL